MNIKMKITKGETVTELEINNPDEAIKVLLVQNVFNLYGGNVDMSLVLDMISKVGRAYSKYHEYMNQTEELNVVNQKQELKAEEIQFQYKEAYIPQEETKLEIDPEQIKNAMLNKSEDTPDEEYYRTGVKVMNGITYYRLRYICQKCGDKGNHLITKGTKGVKCRECNQDMKVKFAHPDSTNNNLIKDDYSNIFRAGLYKSRLLWKE